MNLPEAGCLAYPIGAIIWMSRHPLDSPNSPPFLDQRQLVVRIVNRTKTIMDIEIPQSI